MTGYRDSGLSGALASARASLAAASVDLLEDVQAQFLDCALAPAREHVLALALREAVTNVVRHAGATRCTVRPGAGRGQRGAARADDGDRLRAGDEVRVGNGLTGMRERAAPVGGELRVRVGTWLAPGVAPARQGYGRRGSMIRIAASPKTRPWCWARWPRC